MEMSLWAEDSSWLVPWGFGLARGGLPWRAGLGRARGLGATAQSLSGNRRTVFRALGLGVEDRGGPGVSGGRASARGRCKPMPWMHPGPPPVPSSPGPPGSVA